MSSEQPPRLPGEAEPLSEMVGRLLPSSPRKDEAELPKPSTSPETLSQIPAGNSSHEHHPATKTLDYLGLGIILAPAPEVMSMYLHHEEIDWLRVAISFAISIVLGSAILWFAHGWRDTAGKLANFRALASRADDYFLVRLVVIAFFMISPVLMAPLISGQNTPISIQQTIGKLPTSPEGLSPGTVWNNGGVLSVTPQPSGREERQAATEPPAHQGPIEWSPEVIFITNGGSPEPRITSIYFHGTASAPVAITDAYIISGLTGHKEELLANVHPDLLPLDKIETVMPGAVVNLQTDLKPSLSPRISLKRGGNSR
jgi:hypothetical protein